MNGRFLLSSNEEPAEGNIYADKSALIEFNMLTKQHSKWFETFRKNLLNWMDNAIPAEWSKLETQDSDGKLKKT